VAVDTSTLRLLPASFQRYVRPDQHPRLSAFCTELTSITQDMVDGGVPLRVALADLEAWLREQGLLGQVGRGRPLEATELPAHPAATPASMPGCCASLNSHSLSSRASWPPL
jgi:inhibitor of KinA sporulation pathway (predicted exonuclease)